MVPGHEEGSAGARGANQSQVLFIYALRGRRVIITARVTRPEVRKGLALRDPPPVLGLTLSMMEVGRNMFLRVMPWQLIILLLFGFFVRYNPLESIPQYYPSE